MLGFDSSPTMIPLGILAWGRTSPGKKKEKKHVRSHSRPNREPGAGISHPVECNPVGGGGGKPFAMGREEHRKPAGFRQLDK